jgi:hypothetical protein
MQRIEKTVFISYRRINFPWAKAVAQNLVYHGYDAFLHYSNIPSGDFESSIIGNIISRAHFLIILTRSALERWGEASAWLRREMETALETQRKIIPLMLEGFSFGTPAIANQLTSSLGPHQEIPGPERSRRLFDEAMDRLRMRFLNVAVSTVTHPPSAPANRPQPNSGGRGSHPTRPGRRTHRPAILRASLRQLRPRRTDPLLRRSHSTQARLQQRLQQSRPCPSSQRDPRRCARRLHPGPPPESGRRLRVQQSR